MAENKKEVTLDEDTYRKMLSESGTAKPPVYDDSLRQQQGEIYKQIAGRGPFQYDAKNDPLYGIMKDRYVQQGRMAMRDTMGRAAALTGGYGSSYAQAVGQQQYDASLQGLADVIPELYGQAYQQYQDEGDRLARQYQMLGDQADTEYGRYRDALGDWQYERAWQQQQEQTAYDREQDAWARQRQQEQDAYAKEQDAYSREQDRLAWERQREQDAYTRQRQQEQDAYSREQDAWARQRQQEQDAYSREQDAWARERQAMLDQQNAGQDAYSRQQSAYSQLYALIGATGYNPTDQELAAAGMSREAASALMAAYQRQQELADAKSGKGGTGGTGGSGGGGSDSRTGNGTGGGADGDQGKTVYDYISEMRAAGASDRDMIQFLVAQGLNPADFGYRTGNSSGGSNQPPRGRQSQKLN